MDFVHSEYICFLKSTLRYSIGKLCCYEFFTLKVFRQREDYLIILYTFLGSMTMDKNTESGK